MNYDAPKAFKILSTILTITGGNLHPSSRNLD